MNTDYESVDYLLSPPPPPPPQFETQNTQQAEPLPQNTVQQQPLLFTII